MFEVTFTGHQGWVLRTERTCILADTVLGQEFGHGPTMVHVSTVNGPVSVL